jgi:hypothetical protein
MSDQPVRPQFTSMKLDQLVYIELESGNGGMMLTISEEGFSFRAVTPVRPSGRIPFSFSINGTDKLQGFGKIDWTKDDGKVAGLQFTDVTTEFLNAVRKWLVKLGSATASYSDAYTNNSAGANIGQPEFESAQLPNFETSADANKTQNQQPELGLKFGHALNTFEPQPHAGVGQISSREGPTREVPRISPMLSDWNYPGGSPEHTRTRNNGIGITAVAICFAALIVILYGYREAVGQSLITLGQKISSSSETSESQQPKDSQSEPTKRPMEAKATTAQAPAAGVNKENAVKPPEPVIDTHNNPSNAAAAIKPDNAFRDARPSSSPEQTSVIDPRSHDPAEQARTLWSAVAQGNTSAEVALARLYLIGGGVPKSCDQARVLLQAAARKGNGEALDKLSQIDHQGCP